MEWAGSCQGVLQNSVHGGVDRAMQRFFGLERIELGFEFGDDVRPSFFHGADGLSQEHAGRYVFWTSEAKLDAAVEDFAFATQAARGRFQCRGANGQELFKA